MLALLGLMGVWPTLTDNLAGRPAAGNFVDQAAMWHAVRRVVPPDARLLVDFNRDSAMTVWPANIGWALLANRASCFAGWGGAATFVRLPVPVLYRWDQAIVAIFAGKPGANAALAWPELARCNFLLWQQQLPPNLPADWHQAASGAGWRLYQRKPVPPP